MIQKKTAQGIALLISIMLSAGSASAEGRIITLQEACNAALSANEMIKIAEEGMYQSDNRIDQAWSSLYPSIVAKSALTRYNDTLPPGGGSFIFQPLEQFWAGLILTQPLYTGGRTLAALRTAQKMQESSRCVLSSARQDLLLNVSDAYYGALKAQKAVDLSRNSLERMERHKKVTEREAATRKSKANASALLRANTLVSQARIALVRAQDGFKIAREKLTLLTKIPVDARLAEPDTSDQPAENLASLITIALKNRDDFTESKLNQNIAEENVTIVKGGHSAQIYAEAGATYQDSHPATGLDAKTYYGGLRLEIPLFEGGLEKAAVSEAKSKKRQAELSTEFLRRTIESDVNEAYVNLQTISSILETAKIQRDYAKENFDTVEDMFAGGLAQSLSLIDAEQALNMSERELVNAAYDRQVAILKLKKSMGVLGKNL